MVQKLTEALPGRAVPTGEPVRLEVVTEGDRLQARWLFPGSETILSEGRLKPSLSFLAGEAGSRVRPARDRAASLRELGRALGEAILSEEVERKLRAARGPIYVSGESSALVLPLESLALRSGLHLQLDGHRIFRGSLPERDGKRRGPGGPAPARERLRVLVFAAEVEDPRVAKLDHEKEEDLILRALEPLRREGLAEVLVAEGGTREALEEAVRGFRPHVLYLSCHGSGEDGGCLLLEDDHGEPMPLPAAELAAIVRGSPLRLVFIASCHGGELESLAPRLLDLAPEVLAYSGEVSDGEATHLAEVFFDALAKGLSPGEAASRGRKALSDEDETDWALLVHYLRDSSMPLVAPPEGALAQPLAPLTLEGFVGRRRELRSVRRALREGKDVFWVHGPGGIGKSTFAIRAAARMGVGVRRPINTRERLLPGRLGVLLEEHLKGQPEAQSTT